MAPRRSDAVFRRRYRSLHIPPAAAGAYHNDPRIQRLFFIPSPSATVDGRHFSLDFLPGIFAPSGALRTAAGASSSWIASTSRKEPVGSQIWSYASLGHGGTR